MSVILERKEQDGDRMKKEKKQMMEPILSTSSINKFNIMEKLNLNQFQMLIITSDDDSFREKYHGEIQRVRDGEISSFCIKLKNAPVGVCFPVLYKAADDAIEKHKEFQLTQGLLRTRQEASASVFSQWNYWGYNRYHAKAPYNKKFMEFLEDFNYFEADYVVVYPVG